MRVKFKTNLGSNDGERFGINFKHCLRDAEVNVPDAVGAMLVKRGWADELPAKNEVTTEPAAKPKGDKKTPE